MADEVSCDTEAKRFNIIAYLNKATLDIIGLAGEIFIQELHDTTLT